ncbi:MAG: FAD-dependent oxidoreductase [Candidatus Aenigmarchaeota archaeon]|nr:FAD-dependent oxidoreductase [Candidatus Aenigmarchaeota archaeon]
MRVVIIGGGTAGTETAFQLRKKDKECEILVLEGGKNTLYSPCSLPYVISGEISHFDSAFVFEERDYKTNGIILILGAKVEKIDRKSKKAIYRFGSEMKEIFYDLLVIATGSISRVPQINGLSGLKYHTLKTVEDAQGIKSEILPGKKALIIGAGYVGTELAYALNEAGVNVSLAEAGERVLANSFDRQIGRKVEEKLRERGITVLTGCAIGEISEGKAVAGDKTIDFDFLVVSGGACANITLARECGLEVGSGIKVNENMQTTDENIFACGDCVECKSFVTGKQIMSQLGSTAVRQAAAVAENLLGGDERFGSVLNASVSKLGELALGSTGLTEGRAKAEGIRAVSATFGGSSRAEYYPGGKPITITLVADAEGKLIGAQVAGCEEVLGRINQLSLAISQKIGLKELSRSEFAYNPCLSPIHDPVEVCAQLCEKKRQILPEK